MDSCNNVHVVLHVLSPSGIFANQLTWEKNIINFDRIISHEFVVVQLFHACDYKTKGEGGGAPMWFKPLRTGSNHSLTRHAILVIHYSIFFMLCFSIMFQGKSRIRNIAHVSSCAEERPLTKYYESIAGKVVLDADADMQTALCSFMEQYQEAEIDPKYVTLHAE